MANIQESQDHEIEAVVADRKQPLGQNISEKEDSGTFTAVRADIMPTHQPAAHDPELDFVDLCKKITKALKKHHSKDVNLVSDEVIKALEKTNEVLDHKDICISVFGQQNCGKSTLINSLIGEELLPVYETSSTSLKVKIQHDGGICIHHGVHAITYTDQRKHPTCKRCPKLQIMPRNDKEVQGGDEIYKKLEELNKEIRDSPETKPPTIVLKVDIPLLDDKVPPGWTVSLVDNPGFGEAKKHVVQLADASLITSSAYIYLLQTESIGGVAAEEFFKDLSTRDESALTDGRLVIGVTKFDNIYKQSVSSSRRRSPFTVTKAKAEMTTSIKNATGIDVKKNVIIPLCGEWALAASGLALCLKNPSHSSKEELARARKTVEEALLQYYPHMSLPCGQEQSPAEVIKNLPNDQLIVGLEEASGIRALTNSIHLIVGKLCVKVWATKIVSEFQNYVKAGKAGVDERCKTLADAIEAKQNDYTESKCCYDKIELEKESIKATVAHKKKETKIWREFETNYHEDIEKSMLRKNGKAIAKGLVEDFKRTYQRKIASRTFSLEHFENNVPTFLTTTAEELQQFFDSSCAFGNVHRVLLNHVEDMVERMTKLRSDTRILCKMDQKEDEQRYGQSGNYAQAQCTAFAAPNLAYIRSKVNIPNVSLSWWEKLVDVFRRVRVSITSPANESKVEATEKESGKSDSDGASLHSDQAGNESNSTSTSESDQTHNESNHSCTYHKVGEIYYRRWTGELEDAIRVLQQNIELECDSYFDTIKPNAIKFFYKEYKLKIIARLTSFEKEFDGPLEAEQKRQKKLKCEIEHLQKTCQELQGRKQELQNLQDQLFHAYSQKFACM